MRSKLLMSEMIVNQDPKFGAGREYYPCTVKDFDGNEQIAMFTPGELHRAIKRGFDNPEDQLTLWQRVLKSLFG